MTSALLPDAGASRVAGNTQEKVLPSPGSLVISSRPWWRCSTCFTMASPRPVPPEER